MTMTSRHHGNASAEIQKAIEELAKDEKIGFVFDKAGGLGLIYAEDKNDITFKVLDRIKRGK